MPNAKCNPTSRNSTDPENKKVPASKPAQKDLRQTELFKRKYFDFYDDVKISVKEDW